MALEGIDFFIRFMELPKGIYAFVMPNDDATFSIFLDPRRSYDQMHADCDHEVRHITRDDFYNGQPIHVIEAS